MVPAWPATHWMAQSEFEHISMQDLIGQIRDLHSARASIDAVCQRCVGHVTEKQQRRLSDVGRHGAGALSLIASDADRLVRAGHGDQVPWQQTYAAGCQRVLV